MSSEGDGGREQREPSTAITLTAAGITLMGVVLSIGLTVAFGLRGPWWFRALAGAAVTAGLLVLVKLGSRSRRGPLARLANWIIGAPAP